MAVPAVGRKLAAILAADAHEARNQPRLRAERAMTLDANDPVRYEAMAIALIFAGQPVKGTEMITKAMRFDPRYAHEYLYWLGLAQFGMERFDEATTSLTQASRADPEDERALIILAAAYGHLGRVEEAEFAIERANELRRNRQQDLAEGPLRVGPRCLFWLALIPSTTWICGRSRNRRIESGCARVFALPASPRRTGRGSLANRDPGGDDRRCGRREDDV
jgi:tetratricopeptide (TPR) repeat protein